MVIKKEERYNIIGAAMEVHRTIDCGFTEYVYQEAFEIEFSIRNIPFVREKHLSIDYKGNLFKHDYSADFVCYDDIIVECKAVSTLLKEHEAQTLNYIHLAKFPVGILLNFGQISLVYKHLCVRELFEIANKFAKFALFVFWKS